MGKLLDDALKRSMTAPIAPSQGGGEHTPTQDELLSLVQNLRSHRIMCDGGNGNVYDIADEDCEAAADIIEDLAANSHATLKARIEELQNPFRSVDDKDWAHLDQFIPQSGYGRFWRRVFVELRDALASKGGVK